jgi:hypothetical protein
MWRSPRWLWEAEAGIYYIRQPAGRVAGFKSDSIDTSALITPLIRIIGRWRFDRIVGRRKPGVLIGFCRSNTVFIVAECQSDNAPIVSSSSGPR